MRNRYNIERDRSKMFETLTAAKDYIYLTREQHKDRNGNYSPVGVYCGDKLVYTYKYIKELKEVIKI